MPDASDACPTTFAQTANGCPAQPPCKVRGALPDRTCTPGATFHVTARQVCKRGYSKRVRNVPDSVKDKVYAEYGVTTHSAATYEVDHLVSLELGGSNSIKNLFPEAAEPRPGFHEKDKLENRLHKLVCARKDEAQDRAAAHSDQLAEGVPALVPEHGGLDGSSVDSSD